MEYMMKVLTALLLSVFLFTLPLAAQFDDEEETTQNDQNKRAEAAPSNYEKIADDTRFYNAYHFYNLKMYPKASLLLSEYVEVYANGIHRKEAIMALGNIEFSRRNYERAASFYIMLFEEFSADEEGVDAYYRAALCYQKMGYTGRAERIFSEIIERYPQSRLAESAKMQRGLDSFMSSAPPVQQPEQPIPAGP